MAGAIWTDLMGCGTIGISPSHDITTHRPSKSTCTLVDPWLWLLDGHWSTNILCQLKLHGTRISMQNSVTCT